jgi:hypothetical protein
MNALSTKTIVAFRQQTLDDLWQEAETLGFLRVYTHTNFGDTQRVGYTVTLKGKRRNTTLEIERRHTSFLCALADAINEAREMGLGEAQ